MTSASERKGGDIDEGGGTVPRGGKLVASAARLLAAAGRSRLLFVARGPLVLGLWGLAYLLLDFIGSGPEPVRTGLEPLLTGGTVLPLLARRRFPVWAWAIATFAHTVLLLETPFWSIVSAAALLVMLGAVAARRERGVIGIVATTTWLATILAVSANPLQAPSVAVFVVVGSIAALAVGDNQRARRAARSDEVLREAARDQERREERGRRALLEERTRIARELHDVVAHHMSMIAVQSETAPYRIPGLPDEGRADFAAINATAREALVELRRLLGVLRAEEEAERAPQPGLGALEQLLDGARATGLPVTLSVEGEPRPLPAGVDLSAYRIVQEAMTNARRHAGAARVDVHVAYGADRLRVSVTDDGPGVANGDGAPGHGLLGMRERVVMLGGELSAGPRPQGGFAVDAVLPLPPANGEAVA